MGFTLASGEYSFQAELKKWLSNARRVVVAGIGNPIRTDDFVGAKVVQDLRGKVSESVCLVECETVPESFIQQIVDFKPSHVLLIDAAILDLKPGDARLVKAMQLADVPAFSTHMLPLRVFCEYLVKMTRAKIALLLIQPKQTDFGEGLTRELEISAKDITRNLIALLP